MLLSIVVTYIKKTNKLIFNVRPELLSTSVSSVHFSLGAKVADYMKVIAHIKI